MAGLCPSKRKRTWKISDGVHQQLAVLFHFGTLNFQDQEDAIFYLCVAGNQDGIGMLTLFRKHCFSDVLDPKS